MQLPVEQILPELNTALHQHTRLILEAPPGAGKTSLVPLELLKHPLLARQKILLLEPRRIAARAAAERLAELLGEKPGQTIGYRMRMDTKVSAHTRLEVVTQGILTRMLQEDPSLEGIGAILFDEFHERALDADLGLALALQSQQLFNEQLRLLVMSATLDKALLQRVLGADTPILSSEGRAYPVETRWGIRPERRELAKAVADTCLQALADNPGSALVFLPGWREIRQSAELLRPQLDADTDLWCLHGSMPLSEQRAAIKPAPQGKRKLVLATALAESSLTINGVRMVIDAGLSRQPVYDAASGMTRLETRLTSRASAEQRQGRAGRLEPGICYRLWSQEQHQSLAPQSPPEIETADLTPLALELARWGIESLDELDWPSRPPEGIYKAALELLYSLGALEGKAITAHGEAISQLGLHPRLGHMLIRAGELEQGGNACLLAALLSEGGRIDDLARALHDAHTGKSADAKRVRQLAGRYRQQLGYSEQLLAAPETLGNLLALAYPDRIARQRSRGQFQLSQGRQATLADQHPLAGNEWLVAAELDGQRQQSRIFQALPLCFEQLQRWQQELFQTRRKIGWDLHNNRVIAVEQTLLGKLVLTEKPLQQLSDADLIPALLDGIRQQGLSCLPWDKNKETTQLRARLSWLHQQRPDDWPAMDDGALLDSLDDWLAPFLNGIRTLEQLNKLDMQAILLSRLDWPQQQALDALAPSHLKVPTGSRIRLDYSQHPPVLAVKVQEMFGQAVTPTVLNGEVAVRLHLLSPAQRPLQVTQDLAGFWQGSWNEVKKEMKGRYPKHHWPDDPANEAAMRGVKHKRQP